MNRNCKQCKSYDECLDDASFYGIEFDPVQSAKYCTEFKSMTNADRLRAMSDEELADFLADKYVTESCLRLNDKGYEATEIQKQAIKHTLYCTWMKWLKQPAEVDHE